MVSVAIRWQEFTLQDARMGCFMFALLLYGIAGSPTPDAPGWAEAVIAALLILAVGLKPLICILSRSNKETQHWWRFGQVFLLFGLSVPPCVGLVQGNAAHLIIRDVAAFIFLCFPIFAVFLLRDHASYQRWFVWALVFIGLLFSWRALVPVLALAPEPTELLYLANSPVVLFTALYLAGYAGWQIYRGPTFMHAAYAAAAGFCVILPMMAMLIDVQRASLGAIAVSAAIMIILAAFHRPHRLILPLIILAGIILALLSIFQDIGHEMAFKTAQVGLNMRLQEAAAVLQHVDDSLWSVLFGYGWGASFISPAVGALDVTYTHSLITYLLLKTGIFGLVLGCCYLAAIGLQVVKLILRDPIRGISLLWPLIIPIILYASHKSLDFGLILLLAVLWSGRSAALKP